MRKSKWLQKVLLCIGGVFLFLAGIGLGWIRCRQTETAFWKYILFAPEPEECVVCDNLQGPRFHAPCLLDLSTGELTELEIYEPCHRYSGELAPDQDMDYNVMTFGESGLPLFIDRTEEIQRCVAYLPEKAGGEIEPSYYCRDCRAKLTKVATQGYVLLDLYDDIIHLSHPTSARHPRMPVSDRAAIFSPFAALTGHAAAIQETARLTDQKIELDEDTKVELDLKQQILADKIDERPEISVVWFRPDEKKDGGQYVTTVGQLKKVDDIERVLRLADGTTIPLDDVLELRSDCLRGIFQDG